MVKYDFNLLEDAIRNKQTSSVPMYEHFVDEPIIEAVMGYDFSQIDTSNNEGILQVHKKKIEFYRQMGYLYYPLEFSPRFAQVHKSLSEDTAVHSMGNRNWVDEKDGVIKTIEDIERDDYWPDIDKAFDYHLFQAIGSLLPEDMKIIGGASGGPFEHASFLMGLESLCIAIYEDEEMVDRLFERIGMTITGIAERLAKCEKLGAYRFGDDLGYKSGTMLSPDMLRRYVFPWQKKVVEVVHSAGKPFVLHSCGNLKDIMDDLIDDVKIDAKHSFEDVIMPVTEAKKLWGRKIGILGGIDVDFLCRSSKEDIKERTKRVMEECSKNGGYAVGSGNTIANYIPVGNYLAMIDAVRGYNG